MKHIFEERLIEAVTSPVLVDNKQKRKIGRHLMNKTLRLSNTIEQTNTTRNELANIFYEKAAQEISNDPHVHKIVI